MSRHDSTPASINGVTADVTVVGSGYAALILVAKYIKSGYRVHHITRDKKFFTDLDNRDELAPDCTSAIAPMRGSDGYHYLSNPETVKQVLEASFALLRAFPVLAEKMIRRRTLYHFLKDSTFSWETAAAGLSVLKATYTTLYNAEESHNIRDYMPSPNQLYRLVEDPTQWEYLSDEARGTILLTIVTTEGLIPMHFIRPEIEQIFNPAKESKQYTVSFNTHVNGIISRGDTHYILSHKVGSEKQKEVTQTSVVNLLTWDRSSQLLRNCFVYRDDQYKGIKPPKLGIRVKQIIHFWIDQSKVGDIPSERDATGKRVFNIDAPLQGLQSSFFGYNLVGGCMLAIDDSRLVSSPAGDGRQGYVGRATISDLTNRLAVDECGNDNAAREAIDAVYKDQAGIERVQASIVAEIERRFKLTGCIEHVKSHLGTVITGTFGFAPASIIKARQYAGRAGKRRTASRLSVGENAEGEVIPGDKRAKPLQKGEPRPTANLAAAASSGASAAYNSGFFVDGDDVTTVMPGPRYQHLRGVPDSIKRCFDVQWMERNPLSSRRALHVEELVKAHEDAGPIILALCMKALNAELVADRTFELSTPTLDKIKEQRESSDASTDDTLKAMATFAQRVFNHARQLFGRGGFWLSSKHADAEREKFDGVAYEPEEEALQSLTGSDAGRFFAMRQNFGYQTPAADGSNYFNFSSRGPSASSSPLFFKKDGTATRPNSADRSKPLNHT